MSDLQEMTQLVEEAAQAYPYREPRIDPILYQVDIPKMMPTAAVPENYVRRNPNEKPVWQPNIRASHVVDQYVSRMREMFVPVWPVTLPCERRARQERLTFDIENKFKLHRDHEKELLRQKKRKRPMLLLLQLQWIPSIVLLGRIISRPRNRIIVFSTPTSAKKQHLICSSKKLTTPATRMQVK